jgi:hypothetical protein
VFSSLERRVTSFEPYSIVWAGTLLARAANCGNARNDRPTMVAAGAAFKLDHVAEDVGRVMPAAAEHNPNRVDECEARAPIIAGTSLNHRQG